MTTVTVAYWILLLLLLEQATLLAYNTYQAQTFDVLYYMFNVIKLDYIDFDQVMVWNFEWLFVSL